MSPLLQGDDPDLSQYEPASLNEFIQSCGNNPPSLRDQEKFRSAVIAQRNKAFNKAKSLYSELLSVHTGNSAIQNNLRLIKK